MPVGGAAIITKLTICHIILLPSKSTIYQKNCCVSFFCLIFCYYWLICYSFCTDLLNLLNLFAQIDYNINAKCFLPVFVHRIVHDTFCRFLCSLLVFLFLTLSCPKCVLVWGTVVRGCARSLLGSYLHQELI